MNRNLPKTIMIFIFFLSIDLYAQREEIELATDGWKIWMDQDAAWEMDTLYLPNEVRDIDILPHLAPSVGWDAMYEKKGLSCTVPATVEEFFSGGVNTWRYHGVSWFWKSFDIPSSWHGKKIRLKFEKTRLRTEVYINEELAGYDIIAETPWKVDVTKYVKYGESNRLAIRITNPGGDKGFADWPIIEWGQYKIPSSHDFGGIGGKVTLINTDNTYIDNVFIKNKLPAGENNIDVITTIKNNNQKRSLKLKIEIYPYPEGTPVYSQSWTENVDNHKITTLTKSITIKNAKLWDSENPNLYNCKVTISGSNIFDDLTEKFGFRVFEAKEVNGKHNLYFNGKRIRLKSAIDWGYYAHTGFYPTNQMALQSVQNAKNIGHNSINFHRRIGEPKVMDYADELGLYIYEEPGALFTGLGQIVTENSFTGDYLEEKVKRMVIRDRNHPSLIWHNLSNEDNSWNSFKEKCMYIIQGLNNTVMISNSSDLQKNNLIYICHIRPYEKSIRKDLYDKHTVGSLDRFREGDLYSHDYSDDEKIGYWGEVACYTGPANWYKTTVLLSSLADNRSGYDNNIYQPLHDLINTYYSNHNFENVTIQSPEDVSMQAGRGLMYINGRLGQTILISNSIDGYAINGWSSGPQAEGRGNGSDWDSAICDEARNLKGPASDLVYWIRELQLAIIRQNGKYFSPGESAFFEVHLINEGKLKQGEYTLTIKVRDGAGNYTSYHKSFIVLVSGGDVFAEKFINKRQLRIPLKKDWHGGYITIEGKLYDGSQIVADGTEQVLLKNRSSYFNDISSYKGAVYKWSDAKNAIEEANVEVSEFTPGLGNLEYIAAGILPKSLILDNILNRVYNHGTLLIIKFDSLWASELYNRNILSQPVTEWDGTQTRHWSGNGWGYLDTFIGNQAVPGGSVIGTNSWEVESDPYGFWPFESPYTTTSYGAWFQREDVVDEGKITVLIGAIHYGKGKILLAPCYQVKDGIESEAPHILQDMLFYNYIKMLGK